MRHIIKEVTAIVWLVVGAIILFTQTNDTQILIAVVLIVGSGILNYMPKEVAKHDVNKEEK